MKKLIENMNEILDLPNKEVVYILKATYLNEFTNIELKKVGPAKYLYVKKTD